MQLKIREIYLDKKKKETKAIKDRILRDIKNLFEHKEEENNYKPVRVSTFWRNNYMEYKSIYECVSVEEYLIKKDIINNLKKSDIWKIYLTVANNYFFHRLW